MVLWLGEGDAYALLGELLRAEYGLGVLPAMARGADGKPYFPGEPELHFNVSHSGGLALCGAGEAPLGVDVEVLRPRRPSSRNRSLHRHQRTSTPPFCNSCGRSTMPSRTP